VNERKGIAAMPVSLKYRTILIHVPKTAGTSIEKVLGVYGRRECLHGLINNIYMQHLTAEEMIGIIGKELFQKFFSIAFVRNPWDKCVSEYAYLQKARHAFVSGLTFDQFIEKLPVKPGILPNYIYQHLRPQSDYLFDKDGNSLVDYIGAFEDLDTCWGNIVNNIHRRSGVRLPKELPKTQTSNHDHYSNYYNSRTREWVARVYAKDIKIHHYQFENDSILTLNKAGKTGRQKKGFLYGTP
jgi:hypothetical protein